MINSTLLKEQLRRFYLIPTVLAFVYILSFLHILYISENQNGQAIRRLVEILTGNDLVFLFGSILLPLVTVASVMSFFVSQKSGTAFYSLPIKKEGLLLTNALAGVILTLAPVLLVSLFMLIPIRYEISWMGTTTIFSHDTGIVTHVVNYSTPEFPRGLELGNTVNTLPIVLGFLVRISIAKLFFFGVFWLAFSLTGHGFVAILLSLFIPLFPAGMMGVLTGIGRMFVYGYHGGVQNNFITGLVWTNPIWSTWLVGERVTDSVIVIALWYLLLTIIVLVSAFFVSRLRMVERFEETVMFSPLRQIMIFVIASVVMIISTVFSMLLLQNSSSVFYASLIIGFIIGFYVAQIITEKSFLIGTWLKIRQLMAHGAVAIGMLLIILFVTQFAMGFYVNHIPADENIVGVFPGTINLNWEGSDYLFLRDSDSISAVKSIHQQLLDKQTPLFKPIWRGVHSYTLYLTYLLDNGRTLQRRYIIPRDFMLHEDVESLMTGEALVLNRFGLLNQPQNIFELTIGIMDTFAEEFSIFDQEKISLFTEAIKQDLLYQAAREYIFRHTIAVDNWRRHTNVFVSTHTAIVINMLPLIEKETNEPFNTHIILILPNYTINLMEEWGLV